MKQKNALSWMVLLASAAILFLLPNVAQATDYREPQVKIINPSTGVIERSFLAYNQDFQGGASVASCDLNGDGQNEIITGAGQGGTPQVRIFDKNGLPVFTTGFFAYDQTLKVGINVTCGDLDGDGSSEIVTGTKVGGAAQIRIFNRFGISKFTPGFYAYAEDFRGGVNVAVGDIDGSGLPEIITSPGPGGSAHIRVFNRYGQSLNRDLFAFHKDFQGGTTIATGNVDGGMDDELIVGVGGYDAGWVKVMKLNPEKVLGTFLTFPEDFKGGIQVAAVDIDADGYDEVIAAVGSHGGPQVRGFEANGEQKSFSIFPYEQEFRGGVAIATGQFSSGENEKIIVAPRRRFTEGRQDLRKYIDVDISEQTLRYYDNGQKIGEHRISTGKWSMPTPLGTFKTKNKILTAYSRRYDLYMDFWMAFTPDGAYGLHALPYWRLKNGGKLYEGEAHLGVRVSHGCIRQSLQDAEKLFKWADIGTPVIVHD